MSQTAVVIRTSRPNFLVMAPLCVGLGVALAWRRPETPPPFLDILLVFMGALLAHAAVNMLNEYEDFTSGLDLHTRRTPFSGGSGALPQLPSAARSVLLGALVTLGLVVVIGLYFLSQRGLPMLILGGAGVALVITYTRWITRSPLLCLLAPGLGFGPVMVLGTVVALGAPINAAAVAVSVISLLLVSTLLLMNQIPDAEADRRGGRYHAVIVLGVYKAAWLAGAMLLASYGVLALALVSSWLPPATALGFITLPLALWITFKLPQVAGDHHSLPPVLAVNVACLLATLALLVVGLSM
jgi:1,4-dihydroxy-2-naphthoate octaprenyltransferase